MLMRSQHRSSLEQCSTCFKKNVSVLKLSSTSYLQRGDTTSQQLYLMGARVIHTAHLLHTCRRSSVKDLGVPGLRYDFQVENACLARAVLEHLNVPSEGMKNFYWPCRMESFVAHNVEFVVDGCHNGQSVQLFLAGLRRLHCDKTIIVVFGGGKDKSLKDMLSHLFAEADHVVFSRSSHFRAASERDLIDATKGFSIDCAGKLLEPTVGEVPLSAAASDSGTIDATMQWLLASAKRLVYPQCQQCGGDFVNFADSCFSFVWQHGHRAVC